MPEEDKQFHIMARFREATRQMRANAISAALPQFMEREDNLEPPLTQSLFASRYKLLRVPGGLPR